MLAANYYEHILTSPHPSNNEDYAHIFQRSRPASPTAGPSTPFTNEEIKSTLFPIPDQKAPGPDGYNALFF